MLHQQESAPVPAVFIKDGSVYANSRDVAEFFEKHHHHVLRDIDKIVESEPSTETNFGFSEYVDTTGRRLRSIDMDRDGFTILAMGFTGPKALKFKLAYIAQFNAMEEELRQRDEDENAIIPYTPATEALAHIREARRTFGPKAAQQLWGQLGLPVVPAMLIPVPQMEFSFQATLTAANQNGRLAAA